jgi:hypothetical protein
LSTANFKKKTLPKDKKQFALLRSCGKVSGRKELNQIKMQENQNKKDQPWSGILRQRTAANIKAAEAHRAWKAALDINTLGQSDTVAKKVYDTRAATLNEYNRCHAEAFRLSERVNSMYRDMAGSDDDLFSKSDMG